MNIFVSRNVGYVPYRLLSVAPISSTSIESETSAFKSKSSLIKGISLILIELISNKLYVVYNVLTSSCKSVSNFLMKLAHEVGSFNGTIQVRTRSFVRTLVVPVMHLRSSIDV